MNSLDAKLLRDVTMEDLQALVDAEVKEGREIEYKQCLPGETEEEKKKFLASASSFANASGGHLLYGVRERRDEGGNRTGLAESFPGILENPDMAIQRIENMLGSGIEPRIPGLEICRVPCGEDKSVIILRIPRSWIAPHMITYKEWCRFYTRNSSGKYRLDVGEIRGSFLRSQSASRYITEFQAERLGRILAGETPLPLPEGPLVAMHLLPLTAVEGTRFDVRQLSTRPDLLPLLGSGVNGIRVNFDGVVAFDRGGQYSFSRVLPVVPKWFTRNSGRRVIHTRQ